MTEAKNWGAFKVSIAGLKQTQELVRSISETHRSLGAVLAKNATRQLFDASALSQLSLIQKELTFLRKSITPTLEIAQQFAKQRTAIIESLRPAVELRGIYAAQFNALASIIKIKFPVFDLLESIRRRRDFVHRNLETELKNLDEKYFKMWDGSWKAVNSDNPDKIRQSANSMRELFRTLLHDYSDDKQIREENLLTTKGDITRRQRLSFILKNSSAKKEEIDHLDFTILLALEAHDKMAKAAHEGGEEEKFKNQLFVYEGFIWMILETIKARKLKRLKDATLKL